MEAILLQPAQVTDMSVLRPNAAKLICSKEKRSPCSAFSSAIAYAIFGEKSLPFSTGVMALFSVQDFKEYQ